MSENNNKFFEFQLLSDLHTEFPIPNIPTIQPRSKYLFLAGDIGYPSKQSYRDLLLECAEKFEKVFVIAGNHEYYHAEYNFTKSLIQQICDQNPKIEFLDKKSVVIDDVRIIGATLWSFIDSDSKDEVSRCLNDYHLIKIKNENQASRRLTVDDTVSFYNEELQFITNEIEIAKEKNQKVIVCTHHAPLLNGTSHPRFIGSSCNCAFSSDLSHLLTSPILVWCFGHTHYSNQLKFNGVTVISNQAGYGFEKESRERFHPNQLIRVDLQSNNVFVEND